MTTKTAGQKLFEIALDLPLRSKYPQTQWTDLDPLVKQGWEDLADPHDIIAIDRFGTSISRGDYVQKTTGDYRFEGFVLVVFKKLDPSPVIRLVVENKDGIVHIFSGSQLQKANQP